MVLYTSLFYNLVRTIKQLNYHRRIFYARDIQFQCAVFVLALNLDTLFKGIRNLAVDILEGSRINLQTILYAWSPIGQNLVAPEFIRDRLHTAI